MTTMVYETADTIGLLRARDVMTREVATVDGGSTVGGALTLMRQLGVRHLPITEHGRFVGLVDDRLVTRALLTGADRDEALEQPVEEVMTRYVPQVGPDAKVTRVSRLLSTSRSDAVVVVDDKDRLLGLITLVDVVGAVAHALAPES